MLLIFDPEATTFHSKGQIARLPSRTALCLRHWPSLRRSTGVKSKSNHTSVRAAHLAESVVGGRLLLGGCSEQRNAVGEVPRLPDPCLDRLRRYTVRSRHLERFLAVDGLHSTERGEALGHRVGLTPPGSEGATSRRPSADYREACLVRRADSVEAVVKDLRGGDVRVSAPHRHDKGLRQVAAAEDEVSGGPRGVYLPVEEHVRAKVNRAAHIELHLV